ncbi:hypothetical protein ARMGADRAFT_800723 [Armillaria gallica]|uniref:Uncharacterized protein n=1 Tax=Armillaria gallica TaxID=47427 RepID=A0A2H3E6Z4_ARMGA|nr:hypothetical protein ARMGADRAFT_800723 [Armillaria gallica]
MRSSMQEYRKSLWTLKPMWLCRHGRKDDSRLLTPPRFWTYLDQLKCWQLLETRTYYWVSDIVLLRLPLYILWLTANRELSISILRCTYYSAITYAAREVTYICVLLLLEHDTTYGSWVSLDLTDIAACSWSTLVFLCALLRLPPQAPSAHNIQRLRLADAGRRST